MIEKNAAFSGENSGGAGIRTLETPKGLPVFKTGAADASTVSEASGFVHSIDGPKAQCAARSVDSASLSSHSDRASSRASSTSCDVAPVISDAVRLPTAPGEPSPLIHAQEAAIRLTAAERAAFSEWFKTWSWLVEDADDVAPLVRVDVSPGDEEVAERWDGLS
jgi:hypothetical protein